MTLIKRFVKPSGPSGGHLSTLQAGVELLTVQSTNIDSQKALCVIERHEVKKSYISLHLLSTKRINKRKTERSKMFVKSQTPDGTVNKYRFIEGALRD
jgi:hypothetical protein